MDNNLCSAIAKGGEPMKRMTLFGILFIAIMSLVAILIARDSEKELSPKELEYFEPDWDHAWEWQ